MTAGEFNLALAALGFSQVEFAKLIGVHDRTVRKWALNQSRVPGPVIVLLNLLRERPELVQVIASMEPPDPRARAS